MNTSQNPSAQNPAPATPQGENDFQPNPHRQHLPELERRYRAVKGSFEMLTVFASPNAKSAAAMVEDAQLLLEAAKKLQASLLLLDQDNKSLVSNGEIKNVGNGGQATNFQLNPPRRVSLADLIKQQDQERGLKPLPLEPGLLLKRVGDGGYSGQFLADAFLSAYRTDLPFPHSLGGLIKLDTEGFRLFHEILHIRHISGWSDDALYHIEQQIKAMLKEGN